MISKLTSANPDIDIAAAVDGNLSNRAAIIRIPGPRNPEERDPQELQRELVRVLQEMMINQRSDEVLQVIFNYRPLVDDIINNPSDGLG